MCMGLAPTKEQMRKARLKGKLRVARFVSERHGVRAPSRLGLVLITDIFHWDTSRHLEAKMTDNTATRRQLKGFRKCS